jgi:hypothetical protein
VTGKSHDIERVALDLIDQFGDLATLIARELAMASGEMQDDMLLSAETWRAVIDAIERLLSDYGQAQWLTVH